MTARVLLVAAVVVVAGYGWCWRVYVHAHDGRVL